MKKRILISAALLSYSVFGFIDYCAVTNIAFPKLTAIPPRFLYHAFGTTVDDRQDEVLPNIPVRTVDFRSVRTVEDMSGLAFGCCTNLYSVRFDSLASEFTNWNEGSEAYNWPIAMTTVKEIYLTQTSTPTTGNGFFFINYGGYPYEDCIGWDCVILIKNGTYASWMAKKDGDVYPWQAHAWNFLEITADWWGGAYVVFKPVNTSTDITTTSSSQYMLTAYCRVKGSPFRFYAHRIDQSGTDITATHASTGNGYYTLTFTGMVKGKEYKFQMHDYNEGFLESCATFSYSW